MKFALPIITLVIGLAIGAAAITMTSDVPAKEPALPEQNADAGESVESLTAAWDAERGQLQARIQELDQAVVDRDRIITKLREEVREKPVADEEQVAKKAEERPRGERGGPPNLAQLKERDPEAYDRIKERIAGFTTRMQAAMLNQHEFFDTLDQALMTDEQKENHLKLQETMLAIQGTMDKLNNGELDNAGWEARREMMGTMREIGPMLEMERQVALSQIGHDLGYETQEERTEFVDYMDHVYTMTSPGTLWRSMMGGDRGRRGGRGGGDRTDAKQGEDKK